ncbi:hypothetical protein AMK17_29120 [Streptomyces sp. CB00072]|nr:hypothetical protein AMK17_29120 [Streptomyces sp. CB00072]
MARPERRHRPPLSAAHPDRPARAHRGAPTPRPSARAWPDPEPDHRRARRRAGRRRGTRLPHLRADVRTPGTTLVPWSSRTSRTPVSPTTTARRPPP